MKSFDIISLDLFNTLVYIDRSSFDLWSHMEKSLREFPSLGPEIPLNDITTDYYGAIRHKMRDKVTEREFRNDEILFEVLKQYIGTSQDLTALAHDIITFYFESALPLIHLLPGVHETLDYLKEKEYTLVLTSNHSWAQNGWDVLQKYDLIKRNYFDRITFSGDIGWRKPSPKIFSTSLSGLSYRSKEHIIHVGDDIDEDIKGALEFGIKALWIQSPRDKDKKINNLSVHKIISDIRELCHVL